MKKITIAILFLLSSISLASAELGVKVGVTAQIGEMETSGKETSSAGTSTTSDKEKALFGTAGFFIEKDLKFIPIPLINRLSIGYDNIAHDLDLGTQRNQRVTANLMDKATGTETLKDHSLNAKITGFETVYATLNITDWLYLKAGNVDVDVKTKFSGTSTTKYKTNHSLDGTVVGFGLHKKTDNGMFFRLEYNDYEIDGKSVKNTGADTKFTAVLNETSGSTGRISIGKAF